MHNSILRSLKAIARDLIILGSSYQDNQNSKYLLLKKQRRKSHDSKYYVELQLTASNAVLLKR